VKTAGVLIAIALALALQTTLTRFVVGGTAAVDLVLVAVVYVALTTGPVTGMLAGSAAGLIQDALSSGVIGIGGLAKSIVGFIAGVIGQQFIVTALLPRIVMFVAATVLHSALFMGLYIVLGLRTFPSPYAAVFWQAWGNAAVGMVAFTIIEMLPGMIERRRISRRVRH
jgi:rod shape-determining protein MreD